MLKKWFKSNFQKFQFTSIRKQLLSIFVLITLLPALAISTWSIQIGYSNGKQQAFLQLESLLSLREQKIIGWTDSLKSELASALEQEYIFERISVMLDFVREDYYLDYYSKSIRSRMQRFLINSQYFDEISLLDPDGNVVLSTNMDHEGLNYSGEDFFIKGQQEKTVRFFSVNDGLTTLNAAAALPVLDSDGQVLGVFMGMADLASLKEKMNENTGLGRTGEVYFISKHGLTITSTVYETANTLSAKEVSVLENQISGTDFYKNAQGTRVAGAYLWLPSLEAAIFIEKDLSEVFGVMFETVKVNLVIGLAAVVTAVGASLLVTKSIADPIMDLSQRADGIAKGDWSQISHIERQDELGVLARALNSMMIQLRDLINNLEEGIKTRTLQLQDANKALREANQAIQHQVLQLETSYNISREISSILEPEELFQRVTQLIREAYNLSAVNIFMADEDQNSLVMIAHNYDCSEGNREFEMNIDNSSLNGWAALHNEIFLVNNVSETAEFQFDEFLPDVKSELVVPLRIAGKMIGTLDMQAFTVDYFSSDDMLVFQNLADQIAIAIENARLYENNKKLAVLEERNRLGRELHDSVTQSLYSLTLLAGGWKRFSPEEKTASADEFVGEFSDIAHQSLKEMRMLLYNLRPPLLEQEGLLGALHARLDAVEKRAGIETRLLADDVTHLDMMTQENIYWIAQEALNNSLKHANANHLMIQLSNTEGEFIMVISDDGHGFIPGIEKHHEGLGLTGMRERAKEMNGSLSVVSVPRGGTTVTLRIPNSADIL